MYVLCTVVEFSNFLEVFDDLKILGKEYFN